MLNTNTVLLVNLLNDVAIGNIQLPEFQRGWVWNDERIKGLRASVSRGFPVAGRRSERL